MQLPDPVTYAVPGFVALVFIEMLWARRKRATWFEPKDSAASLLMGLGSTIAGALVAGAVVAIALWVSQFRLFEIGWVWWAWPIAFVLDDVCYYWFHRSAHRVRWFWASHVIHHSSQHYNLTTALRQTWTGFFSLAFIFRLPLFLIGFEPAMVFFCAGLNLIYQFWIHTEAIDRMPRWFEALLNTPSHHRVHHATNPRYLDANYAGVFIIWDKMFGSFVPELAEEPCRFGLVRNLGTFNPLRVAFHEWIGIFKDVARARSVREVLGYIAGPPGWSPDGSRDTSDSIKAKWAALQRGPTMP
jgi:sterol desaturase/sphingolipid hydroxylase (fatty acid hydroxylase superfamily)